MERLGRLALTGFVLAGVFVGWIVSPGAEGVGATGTACPNYSPVDTLGPACVLPSGLWRVRLPSGATLTTHGPDRPTEADFWTAPSWPAEDPPCVSDPASEYHGLIVYARPTNRADRFATLTPELRDMARYANGLLVREAATANRRVEYRMACEANGALKVVKVDLSTTQSGATYSSVVADLRNAGYSSPFEKYWIWVDQSFNGGGVGGFIDDDEPSIGNANNRGPSYAITWGTRLAQGGHNVMMHENGHNLGAVAGTSPNSSGAAHCNDGNDVMCYDDGGPTSNYDEVRCPTVLEFDCQKNDYFHADPPTGSYLESHWNLGAPVNQFVEGCLYQRGALSTTTGGLDAMEGAWVDVPAACEGARYALTGRMAVLGGALGYEKPDLDVCWYAGMTSVRCDEAIGLESGRIPAGATRARVSLKAGFATEFFLAAI